MLQPCIVLIDTNTMARLCPSDEVDRCLQTREVVLNDNCPPTSLVENGVDNYKVGSIRHFKHCGCYRVLLEIHTVPPCLVSRETDGGGPGTVSDRQTVL